MQRIKYTEKIRVFFFATQEILKDDEVVKKKLNFDVRGENMTKEDYQAHHKKHLVRCVVVCKRVVKILQMDDKEIGRVECYTPESVLRR